MKEYFKRYVAMILAACITLYSAPIAQAEPSSSFVDMPGETHWAYEALSSAVQNGILRGENQHLYPAQNLTRAEMAAIINRVFGAEEQADITRFTDVQTSDWFYADLAKAAGMGTFVGDGSLMNPNQVMSRQDVMLVLARALKLDTADTSNLNAYTDCAQIADYAKGAVAAMLKAGYISGFTDQTFRPQDSLTREQMAQILYNIFEKYINVSGTYTGDQSGNVIVNVPGVTLKDTTIAGDLIIGDGVGNGTATLDNVTVQGRVLVRGGGENSLRIVNNSNVGSVIVTKSASGKLRILSSDGARVDMVYVDDGQDTLILEGTFKNVAVESDNEMVLKNAVVTQLSVNAAAANVTIESGSVANTVIGEDASKAELIVGKDADMGRIDVASDASIDVAGSVAHLVIPSNTQGSASVSVQDNAVITTIEVKKDASAVIQTADSATIKDIIASDRDKITIEASSDKKQEIEDQITTGEKPSSGNSGSNGGHGGSSGSSGGSGTEVTDTTVSNFEELKAAAASNAVSSIIVRGTVVIDDDFQCSKPVTIAQGAVVSISDYAIFYDSLVNQGTLTTTSYGRLHIGYRADFTNSGTAKNSGAWFIYGLVKNTGTYIDDGTINAFSGSSVLGMPKTTVYAVYGDCYYADGTLRESEKATDIMTDENITLRTSGDSLQALVYGQTGYDNARKSSESYGGLHLIADEDASNNISLQSIQNEDCAVSIGDNVNAIVPSNTDLRVGPLNIYGRLQIDENSTLQTAYASIREHGVLDNRGTYQLLRGGMNMYPASAAFGMDGIDIRIVGGYADYYYADGTVAKGTDLVTITGNANVSKHDAITAYTYGEAGLRNAISSGVDYDRIVVACDEINEQNNTIHLRTSANTECSVQIESGVSVEIAQGVTLGTSDLEVNGRLEVNGVFSGEYISIRNGGSIYNSGTVDLTRNGERSTIYFSGGTFENHGKVMAVDSTIRANGREGQMLNMPGNITIRTACYDYYSADGSTQLDDDSILVTGDATHDHTARADIEGSLGLDAYFAEGRSYDEVDLTILEGESVTLSRSMEISRLNLYDESTLIIPDQVKMTATEYPLQIHNHSRLEIQQGGYVTAASVRISNGGGLTNAGTLDCTSLRANDGYTYEDGVYMEGVDTFVTNGGHMVVNGSMDIEGAHSQFTHEEDAYFACYDSMIDVRAGATLTIRGDINPTGQQQSGFYYDNSVRLYSYYYDDVVLKSQVIADNEIETTSNTSYVVTTEEGLRKALESDADEINVDVPITLTSDIELTKPVDFSKLTVTNGAAVTASSRWWCDTLYLDAGTVRQTTGDLGVRTLNISSAAELTIEQEGRLINVYAVRNDGSITNNGTISVTLDEQYEIHFGNVANNGTIRISGTYDYGDLPNLSWTEKIPGEVEVNLQVNVSSLNELREVIDAGINCTEIEVRLSGEGSEVLVIDQNLDLESYNVTFYDPVEIAYNVTVTSIGSVYFYDDLRLNGTLDSGEHINVRKDIVTDENSYLKVNNSAAISGTAKLDGIIELVGANLSLSGETTFGESMQVQWFDKVEDNRVTYPRIYCYDVVHQLGNLTIPENGRLYISADDGYYEVLGQLENQGRINIYDSASLYVNNDAQLLNHADIYNDGTLKVQGLGALSNAGTVYNDGTIVVNEGGAFVNTQTGSVMGNGSVDGEIVQLLDAQEIPEDAENQLTESEQDAAVDDPADDTLPDETPKPDSDVPDDTADGTTGDKEPTAPPEEGEQLESPTENPDGDTEEPVTPPSEGEQPEQTTEESGADPDAQQPDQPQAEHADDDLSTDSLPA